VLPVCNTHDAQAEAIEGAIRAVEGGVVSTKSMDDSLARIKRMKQQFLVPHRDPSPKEARQSAGLGEWKAVAQEISERGGEPIKFPWTSA
jgi:hypothetical protein